MTQRSRLTELREAIDALDGELLAALNRRAALAQQVGEIKRAENSAAFRPEREAQVIAGLQAHNAGPLRADHIAHVWREIMSACRSLEAAQRVAFLGPSGTFSELAALGYFGSSIEAQACISIDDVFRTVSAGAANFGIVPVENSTEGGVARSLDLLLTTPLVIIGETSLLVRHNLLRARAGLDGVEAVCAHPQALAQCHGWLSHHLPHAQRRAVASNAEGARMASSDATLAAIASAHAAGIHGVQVIAADIQDDARNRTRFAVLADPARSTPPGPSGRDCTSIVVSVANRPGAVHDLLVPLKTHGVSMSRLESRPARSGQWEYFFYIDMQGHPTEPAVAAALAALRDTCSFFKLLGAYPADPR